MTNYSWIIKVMPSGKYIQVCQDDIHKKATVI